MASYQEMCAKLLSQGRAKVGTLSEILDRMQSTWSYGVRTKETEVLTALIRTAMKSDPGGMAAPLTSLGYLMASIIPQEGNVKTIGVFSDLGVLAAVILGLRQQESDVKVTFFGHTDEQVAFARGLGVKAICVLKGDLDDFFKREGDFFKREGDMKFDVVIGNPPYQKGVQAEDSEYNNASSAAPIYQKFHDKAEKDFGATVIIMVVPAKCLVGGAHLDEFLRDVLKSGRIRKITRRPANPGWFPGVGSFDGNIVYLWDRKYQGEIAFSAETGPETNPKTDTVTVDPTKYDILLMEADALTMPLLDKVLEKANRDFTKPLGMTPYGLPTDHFTNSKYHSQVPLDPNSTVMCAYVGLKKRGKPQFQPTSRDQIKKNRNSIDMWKVSTAHAGRTGGINDGRFMSDVFILEPGQICTHSYLVLGTFATQAEALNMRSVVDNPLYQWLAHLRIARKISPDVFKWMPKLDWTRSWTAKEIYARFDLTDQEIAYVENYMKTVTTKRSVYAR